MTPHRFHPYSDAVAHTTLSGSFLKAVWMAPESEGMNAIADDVRELGQGLPIGGLWSQTVSSSSQHPRWI